MKIIAPYMSCVVPAPIGEVKGSELDQAIEQGYGEIFVVGDTGIIKYHKLRGKDRYVTLKVDKVPGVDLHPLKENLSAFLPAGKVPNRLLQQIESFFRQVMAAHSKALEAMIWVLYNEERGYHLFVPDQTVGGASVQYDWKAVPSGSTIVVDLHSHGSMNAFFSGTDDGDDRNSIRYSGVFGLLQNPTASTVWRFNYMDRKIAAKLDDIFDAPLLVADPVPTDWMSKVKVAAPVIPAIRPYSRPGAKWTPKSNSLTYEYFPTGSTGGHNSFYGSDDEFWDEFDRSQRAAYGDDHLKKAERRMVSQEELAIGGDDDADVLFPKEQDDYYDYLTVEYGVQVADNAWDISNAIPELAGEDVLLAGFAAEMLGMITNSDQALEFIKKAYHNLDDKAKEKLMATGF